MEISVEHIRTVSAIHEDKQPIHHDKTSSTIFSFMTLIFGGRERKQYLWNTTPIFKLISSEAITRFLFASTLLICSVLLP